MMPAVAIFVSVAVAAVRAAFGLKWGLHLHELRSKAMEHILDHVVGPNAKNVISNFRWQVPVSQMPRQTHELMRILVTDFNDGLCRGPDLQPPPVFELQAIAVGHRDGFRQVQKDILSFISSQANSAAVTRVKIESESALGLFLRPMASGSMNGSVVHGCSSSIQEIALGQRQHFRGFTGQQTAVGTYLIRFRIDFHAWRSVIQHHRTLTDLACVADGEELLGKA
jgi:hypothetical protein